MKNRSRIFRKRGHNRYWWFKLSQTDYVPIVFEFLSDDEWTILDGWYEDTERKFPGPGEISVPGITMLLSLISGNGISSIVQCGHYIGFSTLLIGFLLKRMGKKNCLFSIDIDKSATAYTLDWIRRAKLEEQVKLVIGDSADSDLPNAASRYLGGRPQLIFIDSSHQYEHTIKELSLWYNSLQFGGFIALHDVSIFAKTFDSTGKGGVLPAASEWCQTSQVQGFFINSFVTDNQAHHPNHLVYKDGCGLGLIQKPILLTA